MFSSKNFPSRIYIMTHDKDTVMTDNFEHFTKTQRVLKKCNVWKGGGEPNREGTKKEKGIE